MTTYNNGIHFLEAAIPLFYKTRRDGILVQIGEYHKEQLESAQETEFQTKLVKSLQADLVTLKNSKEQATRIFKLLETARLPDEHESDFTKRIIEWLTDNLPEGGFLKR